MFCTNCGTKIEDNALFCHNCGTGVVRKETYTQSSANAEFSEEKAEETAKNKTVDAEFVGTEVSGDFIDDDVEKLIGDKKFDYYINRFAEMKQKNKKAGWNWCAFLFGPAWMIYRKMYVYAAIYWLASILLLSKIFLIDIFISVAAGVYGNKLYMTHLEKTAVEAKALQEPQKTEFIRKNGGTSAAAVFIGMGVAFTLSFVSELVFGGLF